MHFFNKFFIKLKKKSSSNRVAILILFVLTLSKNSIAQKLTGEVVDIKGKPIEFVSVSVATNNKTSQVTLTDKRGLFRLESLDVRANYKINFSAIGYESIDTIINLSASTGIQIKLNQQQIQLKDIQINTNKMTLERRIDRTIFNVENTFSALRGDAFDVLGSIPGLGIDGSKVSILGKGTVSVMVNDKILRVQEEDLANYLKGIPSNSIESIEIITTPPAKYSAEGNGGLINIKLKKLPPDYWSAIIRPIFSQRTYSSISLGGNYNYRKKSLQISSSVSYSDGSSSAVERPLISYSDQFWNSVTERRDYTKGYNGRFFAELAVSKKLVLGLQAYYSIGRPFSKDSTRSLIYEKISNNVIQALQGKGNNTAKSDNMSFNANATYSFGKKGGKISFDVDYYSSDRNSERVFESQQSVIGNPSPSDFFATSNRSINTFENFAQTLDFYHPIQDFTFNYGINFFSSVNKNNLNALATKNSGKIFENDDIFRFSENTGAIYSSINFKISKKLEFQGGIRIESTLTLGKSELIDQSIKNDYFKAFPSTYFSYQPNDSNTFSFNYSKRIERPSYTSLNPFTRYINQFYYSVGNPFLLPAIVDNIELNYFNRGNFTATLYGSFSNNQIAQTAIPQTVSRIVVDSAQNFFDSNVGGIRLAYVINQVKNFESINVLNSYYRKVIQKDPLQAPDYKGYSFTYNTDNSYKLGDKYFVQMGFFYYAPQYLGIYRQSARSGFSTGFRFRKSDRLEAGLSIYDLFKSSQAKLVTNANGTTQEYINFYDNRYFRLTIQYKIGSTKISPRQRTPKNESERQRIN